MSPRGQTRLLKLIAGAFLALILINLFFRLFAAAWEAATPLAIFAPLALIFIGALAYCYWWVRQQFARMGRVSRAARTHSHGEMMFLSHRDFEHFVGGIYEGHGYRAEVTRQSGDNGIDIVLTSRDGVTGVQVKHYKQGSRVGRPEIHQLAGACRELGYTRMIFVTSADYTAEARIAAQAMGMELIDGQALEKMASTVFGPQFKQKTLSFGIERRMRHGS